MIYLKKQHSAILFLVAFIATLQVGLVFRTERLIKTVEAFEPVVIEYVEPEKCVVVMTESGNIKRVPTASFKTQKRKSPVIANKAFYWKAAITYPPGG